MPAVVSRPVFSLAGSQSSPRATVPPTFRDPLPLGVRLYSIVDAAVERWITRWVDDIQFRSVVPGGFASATITLRIPRNISVLPSPDPLGFSQLTELFRRIQVVDLRTMEVAWEGRIEDPARQVEPDTWQIGALGSMVAATDIQRPVFYIDSDIDSWQAPPPPGSFAFPDYPYDGNQSGLQKNTDLQAIELDIITYGQVFSPSNYVVAARWNAAQGYDQYIGRFATTHVGNGPSVGESPNFSVLMSIFNGSGAGTDPADVTGFTGDETRKFNVIGTDFSITDAQILKMEVRRNPGTSTWSSPTSNTQFNARWRNPSVQALRMDRFGNDLTASSNYTHGDYVLVKHVVEDVLGRFLVGGWYNLGNNTPWPGSVRPTDAFIDTSDTTQILHLTHPDGATAADILNDMVTKVQTNAYWAIWESTWKANDGGTQPLSIAGYRFEYATWPNSFGYLATSQDGFEGQPNGDGIFNFIFYRYQDSGDGNAWHVSTTWAGGDMMVPEMNNGGFTRAVTVNKQDPTDGGTAGSLADAYRDSVNKVLNAGTLTVKRPIQFYDAGANSYSGGGRMLDPWMLRPGKLIRIADLPPRTGSTDLSFGTTLPTAGLDGTLFRVVATEYSSRDNSARLELDQVARWRLPTQISQSGGGPKTIRIQ